VGSKVAILFYGLPLGLIDDRLIGVSWKYVQRWEVGSLTRNCDFFWGAVKRPIKRLNQSKPTIIPPNNHRDHSD
jgi:hypothetical protein